VSSGTSQLRPGSIATFQSSHPFLAVFHFLLTLASDRTAIWSPAISNANSRSCLSRPSSASGKVKAKMEFRFGITVGDM
jgi:hypothetical protein